MIPSTSSNVCFIFISYLLKIYLNNAAPFESFFFKVIKIQTADNNVYCYVHKGTILPKDNVPTNIQNYK